MRIMRHTTQLYETPFTQATEPSPHFFDFFFCWAGHQPQRVGIGIYRRMCILIQTFN